MENQSNYEIAQQRIQKRARTRNVFHTWLGFLIFLTVLTVAAAVEGGEYAFLFLITMAVGLVTAAKGMQVYLDSLPASNIEKEMTWLYGAGWRDSTGVQELAIARDRIRKRWRDRWRFALHLLLFILVNGLLLPFALVFTEDNGRVPVWLLAVPAMWAILLLRNAVYAFSTAGMLHRRERAASQALELELQSLQPKKQKRGEKPKHLVLGDDGELVEIPDTPDEPDEKSKRIP